MSGRYDQLGRQLRKVRSALAKGDASATSLALRRATHLASDLVFEQVETDDVAAGIAELVTRHIVDATLAERLTRRFAVAEDREQAPAAAEIAEVGRDLDRLLRSLEHAAAMPELPFAALETIEAPVSESRAAVTISGRNVVIAGRGGEGLVFVDDRPIGRPFPMFAAPSSKAEIHRDPSGRTRIDWVSEGLTVELGADFASSEVRPLAT
ncbi:MAG: hypothetical protein IPQ07_41480 [Myxococcales bacterium]|nr:hypothetical protein [Myxococcales bacterium]